MDVVKKYFSFYSLFKIFPNLVKTSVKTVETEIDISI